MPRTKGSKNIDWDDIVATLREQPGRWIQHPQMRFVPIQTVDVIRKRKRRQLRLDDGRVYCRRRVTLMAEDGRVMCSLILRFILKEHREQEKGLA